VRYRSALFLADRGSEVGSAVETLRRLAPSLEHLVILVPLPPPSWLGFSSEPALDDEETVSLLKAARSASASATLTIEVQRAPELASDALDALCSAHEIDLLVFGSRSLRSASASVQRKRLIAVLWLEVASTAPDAAQSSLERAATARFDHIAGFAFDSGSRAAIRSFLRDHADASTQVAWLSPTAIDDEALRASLQVSGIDATVEVSTPSDAASVRSWLDEWTRAGRIELLVVAHLPTALLLSAFWPGPVLLVPPLERSRPFGWRALDICDVVDDGGPLRLRIDHLARVGTLAPVPEQSLAFVSGGRVVATIATRAGEGQLPAGIVCATLGVYRVGEHPPSDPLAAIEARIAIVQRGTRPLWLFDAELPDATLRALEACSSRLAAHVLAIRLRPSRSCRALRARLRATRLRTAIVDARAVLDEGEALDVSEALDAVRLARVAVRLRAAGFPVTAIVHRGPLPPTTHDFVALTERDLGPEASAPSEIPVLSLPSVGPSNGGFTPFGTRYENNRIELELDNRVARGWLLEAIERATQTLHFQVYMASDDELGRRVEAALAEAGARGVAVRVLVDSLHGLHGSFGTTNPLFARLASRPGVEVRVAGPITELPSLAGLKQRDHRKLVLADGQVALLGGRNLAGEYYTAFEEVPLTPASPWRELPWLDAGARIEGPAVLGLSNAFLDAWSAAGGAPFDIVPPRSGGSSAARVVLHRGLCDAHTLEAYLGLIEGARSHLYIVHGFPLVLELQHALLGALQRGIAVRILLGHVAPTHGGLPFEGPWATARNTANELVHSRTDPIVEAGGEVFLFARRDVPGWAPELGVVSPHVHAKVMSVDGLRCSVGSANMDITASYWESELMLVVEDAALARAYETQIAALIDGASALIRTDPVWQQLAKRRAWMRHWPGVLSL
jgi:phosphatidylserine/phosphatidylglycerophosphate/cardiolipin synthase-like enzyme